MRALCIAALALVLCCACSIFNKPDRGRLDGGFVDTGVDAGTDTGMDAGPPPPDMGHDAWAPDAWMCPTGTTESDCGNGQDDDCDGLVDCADPECLTNQAAECCVPGQPTVTETFTKDTSGWMTSGNWNAGPEIANAIVSAGGNGQLIEMGSSADIGMVNRTCLHVDLGTELRFDVTPRTCMTGSGCSGHVDVVLGPSTSFTGSLVDDIAVRSRTTDDGHLVIEVLQGDSVRATYTPTHAMVSVTVSLAPGVVQDGSGQQVPAIVATIGTNDATDPIVSQLYVTDRDVFGTSACHGLHVGVQGSGNHIALDNVALTQLDCSNPGRFRTVTDDDILDAVTVSTADATTGALGWGHGGIGDPALFEGVWAGMPGTHHFTLLFDGSPVDRASDVIGHLPLAIGAADISGPTVALTDDCSLWTPFGGGISCPMNAPEFGTPLVTSAHVMRDPALYPENRNALNINQFHVVWVGEQTAGGPLSVYSSSMTLDTSAHVTPPSATMITNESATTCPSIRNPLLLPLGDDWLLLYVCDSFPPVVHAAHYAGVTATLIPGIVLGPEELGPLAAQGVIDIAGVLYDYVDTSMHHHPLYRLWLVTRPTTTDTAVLYLEGRPPDGMPVDTPPVFTSFAGNPVLTERSSVFDSCMLGCQLHGITATRISNAPTRVRLLLERWVDTGSGLNYGLVPFEQTWPSDAP